MQSVLKKQLDNISLNSNHTVTTKDDNQKKEIPKLDKYMSIIGQLLHLNSNLSNVAHSTSENMENFDKRKAQLNNKNAQAENEQKFSISQLRDKNDLHESHKKGFFVLKDELDQEDDDIYIKLKREILVSKLMYDKSIIIDRQFQSNIYDLVLTGIFLTLSNDSRKILLDEYNMSPDDFNMIHSLIGYDKEKLSNNIGNETISHLCQKFVSIEDCKT